jgi:CHASE3 domain sensor protein
MKAAVERKINLGFGLSLGILVGVSLVSCQSTVRLVRMASQVANMHEVIESLDQVFSRIKDAETGQRGYIITGEEHYLEPYQAAVITIDQEVEQLEQLMADQANQQQHLETLKSLIDSKFAELDQTINLRRNRGFEAATQIVLSNRGKEVMDQIRWTIAEMEAEENRRLQEQSIAVEQRAKFTILIIIICSILAFILVALANFIINRDLLQRRRAEAALQKANDELEFRVQQRTSELYTINKELQAEIAERKRAQEEAIQLNTYLEQRVAERTAQLELVNRELEAFCYSVSHDLRTPLRSIDGFSQALLEDYADRLDAHGQNYLNRVRMASQRMAQLIDDLLGLSRVTRADLHRTSVDLSAIAQEIVAELQEAQPDRSVNVAIAPGILANGDAPLLRIVLDNLLSNAWKFTAKQPQAKIEFDVKPGDSQPIYVVRDNGAGFEMAYVNKLFGAFQRLHAATEFPGTGIGLATVQRIIHRHGGEIWAEGAVNQGAAFYFTLNSGEPIHD